MCFGCPPIKDLQAISQTPLNPSLLFSFAPLEVTARQKPNGFRSLHHVIILSTIYILTVGVCQGTTQSQTLARDFELHLALAPAKGVTGRNLGFNLLLRCLYEIFGWVGDGQRDRKLDKEHQRDHPPPHTHTLTQTHPPQH